LEITISDSGRIRESSEAFLLMIPRLHDDELSIDLELVRKLVNFQFPQYADLSLSPLSASGSTNILFRLGDHLLVRVPRQPGAGTAIAKEQRWLPVIGVGLPVSVPEFVGVGQPAFGYPEQWSIVKWLEGELPNPCDPMSPCDETANRQHLELAADLADVILALRNIELPSTISAESKLRNYRGRSLQGFDQATRYCIEQCRLIEGLDIDLDVALEVWSQGLSLPGASEAGPDRWYHGDLVCENLLLVDGKLTSVLDFGGLAIGDPTIDLHGAWELFDAPARAVFRARLGVDDAEWARGRAWALAIALGTFSYYWTKMPGRMRSRLDMARSVLADAAQNQ
jgi:aminoglycoside phosphotransferase (APT) family kinase protein